MSESTDAPVDFSPADVLIIGAGASGAAAAWNLTDTRMRIVCLEQGGWNNPHLPEFSIGYVNWLGFLLIVPATVMTVPVGANLAHSLSQTGLKRAFALFLGITSIRMFADII